MVGDVGQHQSLGGPAGLDVAAGLIRPVEWGVLVDGFAVSADRDRPDRAQEDEPSQVRPHCDVEDVVQTFDVGLEQRSGIS